MTTEVSVMQNGFKYFLPVAILAAGALFAEPLMKNGEKIAFLGDSITEFGDWPAGYINMVMKGFEIAGIQAGKIPVGHSAETSDNMARRFDRDVVAQKPAWVTISCGVNDVARMKDPKTGKVDYEKYRKNVREMLDKAVAAGIKPVLLTPTLRYEEKMESDENQQILELCAFLNEEAKARQIPIADLNARMRETLAKMPPAKGPRLTRDGVHMNFLGNAMMAKGVLEAFGVETTPEIEASWRDLPDGHCYYQWFSWAEIQKIEASKKPGEDRKHCAERILREAVAKGVRPPEPKPVAPKTDDSNLPPDIVFLGDRVMSWGDAQDPCWLRMTLNGLEKAEDRHLVVRKIAWWLKDETEAIMEKAPAFAAAHPKRAVLMLGSREMRTKGQKEAAEKLALVKERLVTLIDLFVAAKTETVVCGHPVMEDDLEGPANANVIAFNAWLKEECAKRGAKFVDLYAPMAAEMKARAGQSEAEPVGDSWFFSGWYHMIPNFRGHKMIAENVLAAFGVKTTDEMADAWAHADGSVQPQLGFSLNEWDAFEAKAKEFKMDVPQYASAILKEALR